MNKVSKVVHSCLIALSMLASSMPIAFADEIPDIVSGIAPDRPSPKLFGGVEHKIMLPQTAADQFIKQTPTLAPVPPARPLIGGIEHLEKLPKQVLAAERPRYDSTPARTIAPLKGREVWFRIPAWMAGTWQTQDKTLLADVNFRTGAQKEPEKLKFGYCGETYGLQKDTNGTFWQFEKVGGRPTNYKVDEQGIAHYSIVDSNQPISVSDNRLVLRKIWRNIAENTVTNEITAERHFQSILTFTPDGENWINVDETATAYDDNGMPLTERRTLTARCRVKPYQEVAQQKDFDVRGSFANYLANHGKSNLLVRDN